MKCPKCQFDNPDGLVLSRNYYRNVTYDVGKESRWQ